ncbi:phage tail protein [Pseudomonas sp. MPR-ANC1]|uniref:phage tail protein n=1 Tax=Pseudomonas sp. MPR-ANC1 TaxID=2075548 RepID=UPI00211585FE|nr:phage tail protein [Pseudomonas sp. MPR-ANC1]
MYYILDSKGGFRYSDATNKNYSDWTLTPVPQPCWSPRFSGIRDDTTGEWSGVWVQEVEPVPTAEEMCFRIDAYADEMRRLVAVDPLRAVEYERTAAEAQAFKDAGYPEDAVPRTVAAWAIMGRTAEEAADGILTEAAKYAEVLYLVRERRLEAKELIRRKLAAGEIDEARQVVDDAIKAIQTAVSGSRSSEDL